MLDILFEEREAVKKLNKIQSDIEFKHEFHDHINNIFPDCTAKEDDLRRIDEDIIKLQDDMVEAKKELAAIRCKLALYIRVNLG